MLVRYMKKGFTKTIESVLMNKGRLVLFAVLVFLGLVILGSFGGLLGGIRQRKPGTDKGGAGADAEENTSGIGAIRVASSGLVVRPPEGRTVFTLGELLDLCHNGDSLTITRSEAYAPRVRDPSSEDIEEEGQEDDEDFAFLGRCFVLEIAVHQAGRSMGHCSDFAEYILHGHARLTGDHSSHIWAKKLKVCPKSTYLHFEGVKAFKTIASASASLPHSQRPHNWWAPNIEQVSHEQMPLLHLADRVLCKTRILCDAIAAINNQSSIGPSILPSNSPSNSSTTTQPHVKNNDNSSSKISAMYISHSSPDAFVDAQRHIPNLLNVSRDYNAYFHSYGHSGRKRTDQLYACWRSHPEWPLLVVVAENIENSVNNESTHNFKGQPEAIAASGGNYTNAEIDELLVKNVKVYERLSLRDLRLLQWKHAVHICPSQQEGYGHYINEARALSALTLTTNYPPMNEFITDNISGILIDHADPPVAEEYQGFAPYFASPVAVEPHHICRAVERAMELSTVQREEMGRRARMRYDEDTMVMERRIEELRRDAKAFLDTDEFPDLNE
ncbi:hypothetical protein HK100_003230 [Physocladia obscura]|uniref:Glycosyl transferase family 1 domain-containing protein n=1 Tax=Physocladia obscura TaxID=109957 RepID=A0AAD5SWF7_9FUNG|nr:hypothetical protein HK100_003230 [Physocladia obscura]